MTTENLLHTELQNHIKILRKTISECEIEINRITKAIEHCFHNGNKLLLCGNGGSAADAQHVAAEFVNRFRFDRPALPAIALTTDTSILTAIGNDSSFDFVFSRQVEALAVKGDLLVGISTSGNSANVLKALDTARIKGVTTVGFTGKNGRISMSTKCDYCLVIPSADTARIQECHEFVWHFVCGIVENQLFGQLQSAQSGEKHE
jgi:D-sedoheptulose 7-phosphate isomerase